MFVWFHTEQVCVCDAWTLTVGFFTPPNDYASFFPLQTLKETKTVSIVSVAELGCNFSAWCSLAC